MEHPVNHTVDEYKIDLTRGSTASESVSRSVDQNDSALCRSTSSSPAALEYRLVPFTRGGFDFCFGCSQNSCFWILIELAIIASQFADAVIIFQLSVSEHSRASLLVWIIGYAAGSCATLPRLCWRYIHLNDQGSAQESAHSRRDSDCTLREKSRYEKYILSASPSTFYVEWFFLVWFLVGDAWVYAKHPHSQDDSIFFRICIGFLAYSSLFMLAIITVRERAIGKKGNTHKFRLKTRQIGDENKRNLGSKGKGSITAGAAKERTISAEDAVCCICLGDYVNNDELQQLPCAHIFHMECVELWLQKNPTCPICKKFALFGSSAEQQKYGVL